jgi:hypothetical protein
MADAMSSGNSSDIEKEPTERDEDVNEGTSLLSPQPTYGAVTINKSKEEDVPIYASPARPHLPSPSASNNNAHPGIHMDTVLD